MPNGGGVLQSHCKMLRDAYRECQQRLSLLEHKHNHSTSPEHQAELQRQIDETSDAMNGLSNFYTEDGCSVTLGPIDSPSFTTVPPVHGLSVGDASAILSEAGFAPVASARRFLDPTGVVEGTLPPEGAAAMVGGRVDLLPERAPMADDPGAPTPAEELLAQGIMPDFTHFSPESVIEILTAHGRHAWPRETWSHTVEPGFVITTDPRPNTALVTNLIVVWVSTGPPVVEPPPPPPPPEKTLPPPG